MFVIVKLGIISTGLHFAVLNTAYVASHTGSLDRVHLQVSSSMASYSTKYSCRAKMVAIICWTSVASNLVYYIYKVFIEEQFNDTTMLFLINTFQMINALR